MPEIGKLRAWWAYRQGLDGRLGNKSAADVLAIAGWARSVGGCGPYLGCFARAGVSRTTMDKELEQIRIHELPSARGCTYVIPKSDFALALKVGQGFREQEYKLALKLGVTEKEIEKLSAGIVKALEKEPLEPDALKEKLGGLVRNLGDAGKKKGLTTTLPVSLGKLQEEGQIRRIPTTGRLDQQRYRYTIWKENPLKTFRLPLDDAFAELAKRYFSWIGPATHEDFSQFAGLGVGATKKALEPLNLQPLDDDLLLPPDLMKAFSSFKVPKDPQYALVGSLDGITLHRRNIRALLDEADVKDPIWKALDSSHGAGGNLRDLPSHAIVDRGRIVGLWEYDPERNQIVWMAFIKPTAALKDTVKKMETFVRDDLGDARSFSLDSPKSRAPRLAALRKRSPT